MMEICFRCAAFFDLAFFETIVEDNREPISNKRRYVYMEVY